MVFSSTTTLKMTQKSRLWPFTEQLGNRTPSRAPLPTFAASLADTFEQQQMGYLVWSFKIVFIHVSQRTPESSSHRWCRSHTVAPASWDMRVPRSFFASLSPQGWSWSNGLKKSLHQPSPAQLPLLAMFTCTQPVKPTATHLLVITAMDVPQKHHPGLID